MGGVFRNKFVGQGSQNYLKLGDRALTGGGGGRFGGAKINFGKAAARPRPPANE